jgi:hypothetical protein
MSTVSCQAATRKSFSEQALAGETQDLIPTPPPPLDQACGKSGTQKGRVRMQTSDAISVQRGLRSGLENMRRSPLAPSVTRRGQGKGFDG